MLGTKAALKGMPVLLEGCDITPAAGSVFPGLELIELFVPERNLGSVMLDSLETGFQSIKQNLPKAEGNMFKLINRGGSQGGENGWKNQVKGSEKRGGLTWRSENFSGLGGTYPCLAV